MKKKTLLFSLVAGMLYLGLTSYDDGLAHGGSLNRTGSKGTTTTCGGSGCHGAPSTATIASIRVDSAGGVAVTKYVAGMTYTVTVTGSHNSFSNFGFQYAAVSGTGTAQVQAGTFTALPALVHSSSLSGLNLIEHSDVIAGTGTPDTTFTKSFSWTAPTAAVGDVSMYLTVNAVNGNDEEDVADVSANTSIVLSRHFAVSVASVSNNISIRTFPNPVSNMLNMQLNNGQAGTYTINVYDLNGKAVSSDNVIINNIAQVSSISTAAWNPGMYVVTIEKDGARQTTTIVKQ